MKRATQTITLLLTATFLIAGCGKGGGPSHGLNEPEPVGDPIRNGVEGNVVKGIVAGASVSIVDANGDEVPGATATTDGNGGYSILFVPTLTPIPQPIQIVIDGDGATSVCDRVNADGSGNDCLNADGTYSSFGGLFTLPPGFLMRAVQATLPTPSTSNPQAMVNPSPLTELATSIALGGGTTLTEESVDGATDQVLGILQQIFPGIDVLSELEDNGLTLNTIPIPDVTDLGNAGAANLGRLSLAVASLAGAIVDLIDPDDADNDDIGEVLANLSESLADGIITNGDLHGLMTASDTLLRVAIAQLEDQGVTLPEGLTVADLEGIADLTTGIAQATGALPADAGADITPVDPADPPVLPTSEEIALGATKAMVEELAAAIDAAVSLFDLDSDTDTAIDLFDDQYQWIVDMYGVQTTMAIEQLVDAVDAAIVDLKGGATSPIEVTGDNLSYTVAGTISDTGSEYTVTSASSTYGNVTVTVAEGTRTIELTDGAESAGSFDTGSVTIVTKDDSDNVLQTVTGSLSATFVTEDGDLGLSTLTTSGNANIAEVTGGTAGGDLSFVVKLTGVSGTGGEVVDESDELAGSYWVELSLGVTGEDKLVITLAGDRADGDGTLDAFTIAVGDHKIMGSVSRAVDENGNITDTNVVQTPSSVVELVLTVLLPADGDSSATGVFKVVVGDESITTGELDSQGTVTFSDGEVQNLNALIFAG